MDVSFHRDYLGFGAKADPEAESSAKARQRRIEALQEACVQKIASSLLPALQTRLEEELGGLEGWSLEVDAFDPQTILFHFPQADVESFAYVKPVIRIELGARSDDWPREERTIRSFIGEVLARPIGVAAAQTLKPERTFWEKATLLHAECHRVLSKPMPSRYARHYHDLARLAQSEVAERALADTALRERVVEHKQVYFRSGWSQYDLAVPGSFRLVPPNKRFSELEKDHDAMRQMFFTEPLPIHEVLGILKRLEDRINAR